jgi:hypothetical protein
VRHSLPTNPRERSARSVRSTTPPNMVRRRRTCARSPRPKNAGSNCSSVRPSVRPATPPRQYPQSSDHPRKRYIHHVLLCEHRCPTEYREPLLPADRQAVPEKKKKRGLAVFVLVATVLFNRSRCFRSLLPKRVDDCASATCRRRGALGGASHTSGKGVGDSTSSAARPDNVLHRCTHLRSDKWISESLVF